MSYLNELVKAYIITKNDADDLKKVASRQNEEIKQIMSTNDLETFETDNGYTARYTVSTRTNIDEDKLLTTLKALNDLPDNLIKTKQYVDMDVLENLMYRGDLDDDVLEKISKCADEKEVVTLRISKTKKGE